MRKTHSKGEIGQMGKIIKVVLGFAVVCGILIGASKLNVQNSADPGGGGTGGKGPIPTTLIVEDGGGGF